VERYGTGTHTLIPMSYTIININSFGSFYRKIVSASDKERRGGTLDTVTVSSGKKFKTCRSFS
jgi:hypothetical protein